jgi:glycosyltransferase involved in cell wall biosynthesis
MPALRSLRRLWRLLPPRGRRRALLRAASLVAPKPDPAPPPVREGVVVLGELGRASGLGEGARLALAALEALGVPAWTDARAAPPGAALLIHGTAPQVPLTLLRLGRRAVRGQRVIGYWAWELPAADPDWRIAAPFVHEVWAPSRFSAESLAPLMPPGRPVRVVPHPLALRPPAPSLLSRAAFGLPDRAVVTLAVLSLASSFARKNPLAAVAAHRAAFGDRPDRLLVLKVTDPGHFPEDFAELREACAGAANIQIEPRTLPRADLHALMLASDIVLSLHRSEGFGLVPAEAMLLGRPVVATDWSATAEFLDDATAAPVPARLVPVEDPRGVYAVPGASWAEPDVDAAAAWLRRLADDPALRAAMGARARTAALARFGANGYAVALRAVGLPVAEPAPAEGAAA